MKLSLLAVLLLLISCSSEVKNAQTKAESLYKEAIILIQEEKFLLATEKLKIIRQKYPYSYYATHADLLQADIHFKQENYVEAAAAYILFKDFHPKHKRMNYVMWKIAESYYQQLPSTFDRDLAPAVEAIKYYKELQRRFPKSDFARNSIKKIEFCEEMLRSKEQYIADFYFKTDVYKSARRRYLQILRKYRHEVMRKHSMVRIIESSLHLKDFEACAKYYGQFSKHLSGDQLDQARSAYEECQEKGSDV